MMDAAAPDLAAMVAAADREWRDNAPDDWTLIDFRQWPRGFHRPAWVVAGHIGCNPLDALDKPTPAARAVNALLTRQCVLLTIAMTRHVPDPGAPLEPMLAWFVVAAHKYQHGIAATVEALGNLEWGLPSSRQLAARRLVRMWEQGGAAAFPTLSLSMIENLELG